MSSNHSEVSKDSFCDVLIPNELMRRESVNPEEENIFFDQAKEVQTIGNNAQISIEFLDQNQSSRTDENM